MTVIIVNKKLDPRPHGSLDCNNCNGLVEVYSHYCTNMKDIQKKKICPCNYNPLLYYGCIYEKDNKKIEFKNKLKEMFKT